MDIIKASLMAAVSGGGGGNLGTKSITENGTYQASTDNLDGYSEVDVDVDTYEDEYQQALRDLEELLACQQRVIAALGGWWNGFDPQDCNGIVSAIENIDKAVEESKISGSGMADDAAQEMLNPDELISDEPTANNPVTVHELVGGEITRKVCWYWTTDIYRGSIYYSLWYRKFNVDVTTYSGTTATTESREYSVGWVYSTNEPTWAEFADASEWAVSYNNDNTGTDYGTANGCRLHIHYVRRWGFPGYNDATVDLYY